MSPEPRSLSDINLSTAWAFRLFLSTHSYRRITLPTFNYSWVFRSAFRLLPNARNLSPGR